MATSSDILDRWFAQTLETYPHQNAAFMASEKDRFRNPVGYVLRSGMAVVVEELLGDMDLAKVTRALEAIMRLRVVQGFKSSEAVGFIGLLRPILLSDASQPAMFETRIEQLGLIAAEQFTKCRNHLEGVRAREAERMRTVHRRPLPSELR